MEQKLIQLQPFMYGFRGNVCSGSDDAAVDVPSKPPPPPKKSVCGDKDISAQNIKRPAAIEPTQLDTLLWCCYILANTAGAYEYLTSVSSASFANSDAMDFRRALVDAITKDAKKIKSHSNQKMTKVALEEVKSNLLTGVPMKIAELVAFCAYYEKNVRVVFDGRLVLTIGAEEADATDAFLFYNSKTKKYSVQIPPEILVGDLGGSGEICARRAQISPELIAIEQYTKPIRGFSSYRTAELEDLYKKLGGKADAATKKDMYTFIHTEIMKSYPLL